jgi:hypothetical protein
MDTETLAGHSPRAHTGRVLSRSYVNVLDEAVAVGRVEANSSCRVLQKPLEHCMREVVGRLDQARPTLDSLACQVSKFSVRMSFQYARGHSGPGVRALSCLTDSP